MQKQNQYRINTVMALLTLRSRWFSVVMEPRTGKVKIERSGRLRVIDDRPTHLICAVDELVICVWRGDVPVHVFFDLAEWMQRSHERLGRKVLFLSSTDDLNLLSL